MPAHDTDILIIRGGINGCGIARDAAGRGFRVVLAEMSDPGSGTSSWSTKLIGGGLRYLEHLEFRLVREALREREILWASAPHIIRPLRFVLPHHRGLRPAWLLRLGLILYDHIGGRRHLPGTRMVNLGRDPPARPSPLDFRGRSSSPTAGSMTPDWSSSTPATQPTAAQRCEPEPRSSLRTVCRIASRSASKIAATAPGQPSQRASS